MKMASIKIPSLISVDESKTSAQKKENEKNQFKRVPPNHLSNKKQKHEFKSNRKRSYSFSGGRVFIYKRRKKETTLPTKFLLGGNICDPLNLNSLQDEEINRAMNAVTPKSSPIPTPPRRKAQIEVIIPPNIRDPLNLINCTDDATYEKQLCSPVKRNRKKSNRKKQRSCSLTVEQIENNNITAEETSEPKLTASAEKEAVEVDTTKESPEMIAAKEKVSRNLQLDLPPPQAKDTKTKRKSTDDPKEFKKIRRHDSMDKIVSPVIPQPGAWKRPLNFSWGGGNNPKNNTVRKITLPEKSPVFKEKNKQYQYGNYNRYYGYRNPHNEIDLRLKCFIAHQNLFIGKDVLDIGCNIGHITLTIARDLGARSIVGIDIDKKLINIARKNICYYVNCDSPNGDGISQTISKKGKKITEKFFPISMPMLYGPVDVPGMNKMSKEKKFPHNVTFVQGNYVLEDDALLSMETPQFDVILALSITKWIHLNWGDGGIKRAFRRIYAQLRPGGKFILEPQAWSSYLKKKNLTETIYKNYKDIEFFPQSFTQYLLSSEVGFAKSEVIGCPSHYSKGFQRPILMFTKSNLSPLYSQRSEDSTPSYNTSAFNKAYCLPSPALQYNDTPQQTDNQNTETSNNLNTNDVEEVNENSDCGKEDNPDLKSDSCNSEQKQISENIETNSNCLKESDKNTAEENVIDKV